MNKVFRSGPLAKFLRYEVKGMARKVAGMICDQLPEPTKENTNRINSHTLIDIRDHFLSRDIEPEDSKLLRGVFNLVIVIYDFDIFWRERIDRFVKLIKSAEWILEKGKEEPRYQWWLGKKDAPPNASLIDLIKMEIFFAMRERDGLRAARLKVMQNVAEGLSTGEMPDDALFQLTGEFGEVKWVNGSWKMESSSAKEVAE